MAIDQVFRRPAEDDLSGDTDGRVLLETDGRLVLVSVVEDDCDTSFRNSGLTALVNQVLESQERSERGLYNEQKRVGQLGPHL